MIHQAMMDHPDPRDHQDPLAERLPVMGFAAYVDPAKVKVKVEVLFLPMV